MDPKAFSDWLSGEIGVVTHVSFWVAIGVVWLVIWKVVQREFATRLANAESTNEMLRERLERSETSDAMAIAATSQQLEVSESQPAPPSPLPLPIETTQAPAEGVPPPLELDSGQEVSAKDLMDLLEGRTALQSTALISRELGKMMVLEGSVREINVLGSERAMMALKAPGNVLIFCMFTPIVPELEKLSIGDVVKVEGRLSEIKTLGVTLEECVLISPRA